MGRRTQSSVLLLAFGLVLSAATASALATPSHCCPEMEPRQAHAPAQPCTSLVPAACCDAGASLQAVPALSPPPGAYLAWVVPPGQPASALARLAATRPLGPGALPASVLRL